MTQLDLFESPPPENLLLWDEEAPAAEPEDYDTWEEKRLRKRDVVIAEIGRN